MTLYQNLAVLNFKRQTATVRFVKAHQIVRFEPVSAHVRWRSCGQNMIVLWLSVQKLCLSYLSLPACFLSLSVSLWFPYRWLFLPLHMCLACHMMQLYPPHVLLWLFLWLSETIWHSDSLLTEMGVIFFYFLFLFLSLFMQTTKWSTMNVFQQRLSENDPLSLWGQPVNGRLKIYSQAPIGRPCISQPPHKCLYQSYHHTRMYMNDFPKDSGVECNLVYSLRYGTYEFEVLALPFYTALQFYATTYEKHLLLFS